MMELNKNSFFFISQLQDWKNEGEWEGMEMWYDEDYGGDVYQLYKYV